MNHAKSKAICFFILVCTLLTVLLPASAEGGFALEQTDLTLELGESYTFQPIFEAEQPKFNSLVWFSTNPEVVRIGEDANTIEAVGVGTVELYAELPDFTASAVCSVTVNGSEPKKPELLAKGADIFDLSDSDIAKINDASLSGFFTFMQGASMQKDAAVMAQDRAFKVLAMVDPESKAELSEKASSLGMADVYAYEYVDVIALQGTASQLADWMRDNEALISIETDEIYPLVDEDLPETSSDLDAKGITLESNVEKVTAVSKVHDLGFTGKGTYVAILDTGLDSSDSDYGGRVKYEKCYSTNYTGGWTNPDDGSIFYKSPCKDSAATANSAEPSDARYQYNFNHGSHVAGIAAGEGGMAPDANIIAVQVFTEEADCTDSTGMNCTFTTTAFWSDLAKGMEYVYKLVKDKGLNVAAVNMSIGSGGFSSACDDSQTASGQLLNKYMKLLRNAGVSSVVAAGNENMNGQICFPACLSNAFAVGALGKGNSPLIASPSDGWNGGSNHSKLVDIMAPGTELLSTMYPSSFFKDYEPFNCTADGHCYMSGTSMATPVVTGALALVRQAFPNETAAGYETYLQKLSTHTVNKRSSGKTFSYSTKVLNFTNFPNHSLTKLANVKATAQSGAIKLTFPKDANATGWQYRSKDITVDSSWSSWKGNTTSAGTRTCLTISGLTNGHVYRIQLRKYHTMNGTKYEGNAVSVYAAPNPAPQKLTAVAGPAKAQISWKKNATNSKTLITVYDASTGKAVKKGTLAVGKNTKAFTGLTNGKSYYAIARFYVENDGTAYYGPTGPKVWFVPMAAPSSAKVTFSGKTAKVSMKADSAVTGMQVLYREAGGDLKYGCESTGSSCSIQDLDSSKSYQFILRKYKTVDGIKSFGPSAVVSNKKAVNTLAAPSKVVVGYNKSKKTLSVATVKDSDAAGISVWYRKNDETTLRKLCETTKASCSLKGIGATDKIDLLVMKYTVKSGKNIYSAGVSARYYNSDGGTTAKAITEADLVDIELDDSMIVIEADDLSGDLMEMDDIEIDDETVEEEEEIVIGDSFTEVMFDEDDPALDPVEFAEGEEPEEAETEAEEPVGEKSLPQNLFDGGGNKQEDNDFPFFYHLGAVDDAPAGVCSDDGECPAFPQRG